MDEIPLIIFEDDHLLVINKPPGISTHSPDNLTTVGLYEWLSNRLEKWKNLGIHQRLDKDTSGVLVFSKTQTAKKALALQFENHLVKKRYLMLSHKFHDNKEILVESDIVKIQGQYIAKSLKQNPAKTKFRFITKLNNFYLIEAIPLTGKTHQIRIHASRSGFPVLGDNLYNGMTFHRLCLHAQSIEFNHPISNKLLKFEAPVDFFEPPYITLRKAFINQNKTNAYRILHGQADNYPGVFIDVLNNILLIQSELTISEIKKELVHELQQYTNASVILYKKLVKNPRSLDTDTTHPESITGKLENSHVIAKENGVHYNLCFNKGYSFGLFLDQRENRNRILTGYISKDFHIPAGKTQSVLNLFAYTCGFSLCAALAGFKTTSVDLSATYLEWGKSNFKLNNIDTSNHEFIKGDVFVWLKKFEKLNRKFSLIIIDPPTFSSSKSSGTFRAERDYPTLIASSINLLDRNGILLLCSNTSKIPHKSFYKMAIESANKSGRKIIKEFIAHAGPDFPYSKHESASFKSIWLQLN